MPTLRNHTHCQVARKAHRKSQNLSKSMSFANAPKEMKIVANLNDKMIENMKCQWVTMYKDNSRNCSKFKGCSSLQLLCNLTGKCDVVAYFSYTYRYA